MQQEEQILECLKKLTDTVGVINENVNTINRRLDVVEQRLDTIEQRLGAVEQRLDVVEQRLGAVEQRLDVVEQRLDDLDKKIDSVEYALDAEIDKVYKIALENKQKIEILLIPYNDRNVHVNEEVAKIPEIDKRLDNVETVVGSHSEAIRKLQAASV